MKNYLALCLTLTLIACGPTQQEKEKIAAVSCAVMSETRNMDAAIRVEKINEARDKIGGEPFLRGDDAIKEAFEYGLCEELVLNATIYDKSLEDLKDTERERERIAAEKRAEEERIAMEKQRIADSKPTVKEEFHPNGELKSRIRYQPKSDGGRRHGLSREWHGNGQLYTEQTYNNGKRYGLYRHWTTEGQLYLEETYKNGQRHGLTLAWEGDGSLLMKQCFSNDKTVDMSNCQE